MKYWIPIDSWNLMESFVTESISPHVFYQNRLYGGDLTRYINHSNEMYSHLIMYKNEPNADYSIEVDDSLLDTSAIECVNKKTKDIFFYPKTIYYKKGYVTFHFKDEISLKGFEAESKIIIEVKTIDKYKSSFISDNSVSKTDYPRISGETLPFETGDSIKNDTMYNSLKGGLVAFACGVLGSIDKNTQDALLALNELKNNMTGLHTTLMMGDSAISDVALYNMSLAKARAVYKRAKLPITDLFDALQNQFTELVSLSNQRAKEIAFKKTDEYYRQRLSNERRKEELTRLIIQIEETYQIDKIISELNLIKQQEVDRAASEGKGKTRKFFPKDSPEYLRKVELKERIESFKKSNSEYKELQSEYLQIKNELSTKDGSQYDNVISSIFSRISDSVNDLLKVIKAGASRNQLTTLAGFSFHGDRMAIDIPFASDAECDYFNVLFNHILNKSLLQRADTSDSYLLSLLIDSGKEYSTMASSATPDGQKILNTLRGYYKYKKQQSEEFEIPNDNRILQIVMSFFIKARGFDQIERFMLNRGYSHKEYAYLLSGVLYGYANLPKTLTNCLYTDDSLCSEALLDEYLTRIR